MIKLIILTGFLGSGKTTLLKEILKHKNKNIAVLINELGDIGLDDKIVLNSTSNVILSKGCLCCNKIKELKDNLEQILNTFEKNGKKLEYVIIETTGIANVAPIVYTVLDDLFLSVHFCIENIITCVDLFNFKNHIKNEECIAQITAANTLVLTKSDLCKERFINELRVINSTAKIYLKEELTPKDFFIKPGDFVINRLSCEHKDLANTLSFEFKKELDWNRFSIWLSLFLHRYGESVLRIKGILDVGGDECVSINGIYHHIYPAEHIKIIPKKSSLVMIFKDIKKDKIIKSFAKFLGLKSTEYECF